MSPAVRRAVFLAGAAVLGVLMVAATVNLQPFGHVGSAYAGYLLHRAVAQTHAVNVVMAVTFDYRGLDTLGEEFILFAAVTGVALLLRESRERDDRDRPVDRQPVEALEVVGLAAAPVLVLVGLWLVGHGHVTPGGGFQGGVVLAAGAVMVYLAGQYRGFRRATPEHLLDAAEGIGAAGYAAVGLAGLAAASSFLANFLPLGRPGYIDSSGTIAVIDSLVGLEVAAAFVLVSTEFLEELARVRR